MTIDLILNKLQGASIPKDVFGDLKGNKKDKIEEIKSIYHSFVKLIHPDRGGGKPAEEAFKLLTPFYEKALEEVEAGTYGKAPKVLVKSKKNTYSVIGKPVSGDIANVYFTENNVVLKIAKEIKLNTYLDNEVNQLKKIHKQKNDKLQKLADSHIPGLLETFQIDGKQTNVIQTWKFKAYTLDQINIVYTDGVDGRHMAWIFKRLLAALMASHEAGVIHGHIIPTNYLVCPEDHNGLLIDWCGSCAVGETLKFMVPQYQDFYAPEVWLNKPVGVCTDIYMAAKLMIYITGGNPVKNQFPNHLPKQIIDFLRGCLIHTPSRRPQSAAQVLTDFTDVLKDVYGPAKWVDLKMP